MRNETRLEKLKQAEDLIREVEFSYTQEHHIRRTIYRAVVYTFSVLGPISNVVDFINAEIKEDKRGLPAKGEPQRECPFVASNFESCPQCRGSFNFMKPYGNACPHCKVNIIDAYEKSDAV